MLEPRRLLKRFLFETNIESMSPSQKKFKGIPFPSNQDPTSNNSELPSIKVHQKEAISLKAQLEPKTIIAFASIDHFLTPEEYKEVLLKLKQDSDFNQSAALYEATYSKSSTNFSIPALSNIYKNANQERYSTLMKAYTEMGAFLKGKLDWNFYQILTFFSCTRHCMEKTLIHPYCNNPKLELDFIHQGFPRTELMDTLLKGPYERLADFFGEKQKITGEVDFIVDGTEYTKFYYKTKDHNNEEILLSTSAIYRCNESISGTLFHTEPDNIEKALKHVDFLYKQIESSTDKKEIINLTGKIFWWICQIKPWKLGDPSIAEMLFRSIWSEKGIPNDPWISSVIPWGETVTEFDVEKFAENFDKLFDRPMVNKTEITTDHLI